MVQRCLTLAARARGRTAPNPMVGAVCVARGRVVGEGFHARAGLPHAEPLALAAAGARAKGATLYISLEPCHHQGRTGPCTAAILAAGIARVVVGAPDNDERVCGAGTAFLRARGVAVETGVCAAACVDLNAAYHYVKSHGRPWVVAKWAQSLDGCVASAAGQSKWLTSPAARHFGHRLRNALDGIGVGRGTIEADDPRLDCRDVADGRDPARVVFDSQARLSPSARVVSLAARSLAPTYLVCSERAAPRRMAALGAAGVRVLPVAEGPDGRLQLAAGLAALAHMALHSLLLEGGPTLLGRAFDEGLIARIYCFVAPLLIGASRARHAIDGRGAALLAAATRVRGLRVRVLGPDLLLYGAVAGGSAEGGTEDSTKTRSAANSRG